MAKKQKSGNAHNKFAAVALVAFGLFLFVIGLMNVNVGFGTNIIIGSIVIGLIMVVLGGILFRK
tara:strand:+ start:116 stop:307 length:192 start_codon:yes stop_codon:yes gene_type:complete